MLHIRGCYFHITYLQRNSKKLEHGDQCFQESLPNLTWWELTWLYAVLNFRVTVADVVSPLRLIGSSGYALSTTLVFQACHKKRETIGRQSIPLSKKSTSGLPHPNKCHNPFAVGFPALFSWPSKAVIVRAKIQLGFLYAFDTRVPISTWIQ